MMATYTLTKSKYIRGLQCEKALFFDVYHKNYAVIDDATRVKFQEGRSFEKTFKDTFPNGIDISARLGWQIEQYPILTAELLQKPEITLFEAGFLFNGVLVLADVLHKEPDGKISIYEVKHSCIMKEVFVKDVAIQRYVIAHNLPLAHFYLVLDSGDGKFNLIDLLQQSPEEEASIADNIYRMKAMLQGTEPLIPMGAQCALPYPCPYREHCQKAQKNKQLELQFG